MSNDDWLELDKPPQLPAIVENETKYSAMMAALKKCSPKQRHYLNALQEACFDDDVARRELAKKGVKVSWQVIRRWEIEPAFVTALNSAIEYTLAAAAVSHVGVLAQLQRAVRVNGRLVKCTSDDGVEYEKFVDAAALNAALDRLAKRVRMFGEEQAQPAAREGPGLVIQINSGSAQQPAIDVTPDRVAITLPEPSK